MKILRFPFNYLKYYFDNEAFSKRLLEINENAQIDFSKANFHLFDTKKFCFLGWLGPQIKVNETFEIPADPLHIFSGTNKKLVNIPVPRSLMLGPQPVSCRLMSATRREGMVSCVIVVVAL
jgi:Hormone-sensitive lipase (HSL) N-terminus